MLAVIEFCWILDDKVVLGLLDFLLFGKVFFDTLWSFLYARSVAIE